MGGLLRGRQQGAGGGTRRVSAVRLGCGALPPCTAAMRRLLLPKEPYTCWLGLVWHRKREGWECPTVVQSL